MEDKEQNRLENGIISGKGSMPFLHHLEELRWRLIKSVLSVVIFSIVSYFFAEYLIIFIKKPLGDVQLYNISVTGSFYAYLKVSLIAVSDVSPLQ